MRTTMDLLLGSQRAMEDHASDYQIGQTRVVSNPRGYPGGSDRLSVRQGP